MSSGGTRRRRTRGSDIDPQVSRASERCRRRGVPRQLCPIRVSASSPESPATNAAVAQPDLHFSELFQSLLGLGWKVRLLTHRNGRSSTWLRALVDSGTDVLMILGESESRLDSIRFDSVRFGSVRFGSVRFGSTKRLAKRDSPVLQIAMRELCRPSMIRTPG
jgi:hypothetical protein